MSNPNAHAGQKPVWQPLPKLHPIEIHSVGFQKNELREHKQALFEAWTLDENQLLGSKQNQPFAVSKTLQELDIEHTSQMLASQEGGAQISESIQSIDGTFLESVKNEAFQNGVLEGKRIQKEEFEKIEIDQHAADLETAAKHAETINLAITTLLSQISKCASELSHKPEQLHDPLKRLALHLAEQITLAELSLSANSIQSLIERSIETLDLGHHVSLAVELNPADLALLQNNTTFAGEEKPLWRLIADGHLLPGSVRVRADDSVVTDFVENRLESLAKSLLLEPSRWQAQSAFHPSRLSERTNSASHIEDALPRASQSFDQPSGDLTTDTEILDDSINLGEKPQEQND